MLKNPEDRRARRSRKLLKDGLLELMKGKDFSHISVRDITEHADVNRGTFYLHYSGTAELLQSLEDDLLQEAQTLIDAHIQETVADGTMRPVFEPILDFVIEHKETCTILFKNNEVSNFTQRLQQVIERNGEDLVRAWFHPANEAQVPYLLSFVTWGLLGLIKEWFDENMALPREDLISTAEYLVSGATARLFAQG
ncbi:TetR/AcrR family transcriptional regulator [Oscillibacter sp.]|uniref:TetR/AcrR family transcriptional regulator n=1 Tax=Oscillibacter sp. TaxID=1945593 RepID=UPI00262BB879|nr:TetR/AcrR family transcriptional regulator [Oscillibacter sp.]MDD3346969.1 TetR/AcrR family transcriptional regulator [Oscillibacter sp.]